MPLYDKKPFVGEGAFIAPNATVIGEVEIGEKSSVWYGVVLRGDVNSIKIGQQTSIGDRAVVHVSRNNPRGPEPTIVGDRVIVGHGAILHACTLADESVVGMGAVVFDKCVLEKHAILEPGAILPAGKRIPSRQVWAGNPAKYVRDATEEEVAAISISADKFHELANKHAVEHAKTEAQREDEREFREHGHPLAAEQDKWEKQQHERATTY
jgi:carbonic anhydrase/acetyltransferase-like protein (isoleucine patch superfamily)